MLVCKHVQVRVQWYQCMSVLEIHQCVEFVMPPYCVQLFLEPSPAASASDAGRGAGWYDDRRGGSGRGFASDIGRGERWYADSRGGLGRGLFARG